MISYHTCKFSGKPAKKVCYSADCKHTAFACMACEQCQEMHDHNGLTTLKNWDALLPDIDALRNHKQLNGNANSQPLRMVDKLIGLLQNIGGQFSKEQSEIYAVMPLKPSIGSILGRISEKNASVTGAEICELTEAMAKGQVFLNRDGADKKLAALNERYCVFLEDVEKMVNEFNCKKPEARSSKLISAADNHYAGGVKVAEVKPKEVSDHERQKIQALKLGKAVTSTYDTLSSSGKGKTSVVPVINATPRRPQYEPSRPQRKIEFTPISDIVPGGENFNLLAKVISAEIERQVNNTFVRCTIGDSTGVVNCRLFYQEEIKKGAVLQMLSLRAKVYNGHIIINTMKANTITLSDEKIDKVELTYNVSAEYWREDTS